MIVGAVLGTLLLIVLLLILVFCILRWRRNNGTCALTITAADVM